MAGQLKKVSKEEKAENKKFSMLLNMPKEDVDALDKIVSSMETGRDREAHRGKITRTFVVRYLIRDYIRRNAK